MKFLEFVPCGRRASTRPDHAPPQRTPAAAAAAAVPATNPLSGITVAGSEAAPSPGKRRRRTAGATPHWRPSLGAISEDGVLLLEAAFAGGKKARATARATAAAQAGRTKAAPQARTRGLDYRDDYRHFTAPVVFPSFTPTAFLF